MKKSTFFLLAVIVVFTGASSWLTLYNVAALPGPKLYNGIILGLAESIASISSGVILQYTSEKTVSLSFCVVCFVFNIIYRLLGAA